MVTPTRFLHEIAARFLMPVFMALVLFPFFVVQAGAAGPASTNIPLDSPLYDYFRILSGFGLIKSDITGLKPFSKSEGARLLLEADHNLDAPGSTASPFAREVLHRAKELLPRELALYRETKAPLYDIHPLSDFRARYVFLDGVARDYERTVFDPGNQTVFGFIGGNLRESNGLDVHLSGTEGTPLMENNEGAIYRRGSNLDLSLATEGFFTRHAAALVEPKLVLTKEHSDLYVNKGYLTIGAGGLAAEVGRDANWFGPGFRGTTTLTNNAINFDQVKLWSPEPLDAGWAKRYIGDVKYALIVSRFDETGTGKNLRQPYFIGAKLAIKPTTNFEIGFNFVRQSGGPGFSGNVSLRDMIFGGGANDKTNSISGIDLRYRIPQLRNSEIYVEYSGEDSAAFWPFVESYVAGIYVPRLTDDGRTNLRLEYFWGSRILYTDHQFPKGYTYRGMTPGHSQGGASQDIYLRLGHYFSVRNHVAFEYFHTERGNEGRKEGQTVETKNAGRIEWSLPLAGDAGVKVRYGLERIHAMNLVRGNDRMNQLLLMEVTYPQ